MSDKDDHKTDDALLAAWLDGGDGLSDAYRALDQPQPPSRLDDSILAAARGAGAMPAGKASRDSGFNASGLRGLLSLAASLVVGIMIGSVFLGDIRLESDAVSTLNKVAPQTEATTEFVPAQARAQEQEQMAASEVSADRGLAAANVPQPQLRPIRQAFDLATEPQTAPRNAVDLNDMAELADLEEIVVTGARLRQTEPAPTTSVADTAEPGYRLTVTTWLQQIAGLEEQLRSTEDVLLQQQFDEEVSLFAERYPGINLDDEMSSLRSLDSGN